MRPILRLPRLALPRLALLSAGLLTLSACSEDNPGQRIVLDRGEDAGQTGDSGPTDLLPGQICVPDSTHCRADRLATCLEGGDGYLVEPCPRGQNCHEGACLALTCLPGAPTCADDHHVTRCAADGSGPEGEPQACAAEERCLQGVCLPQSCAPGERACGQGEQLTCAEDGLSWQRSACEPGERCVDGACQPDGVLPGTCTADEVLCGREGLYRCETDGRFVIEACPEGEACFEGACVACVRDHDCAEGAQCVAGECTTASLRARVAALPAAQIDVPYTAQLSAEGGSAPYTWQLDGEGLPQGLSLSAEGHVEGTPRATGEFSFTATVRDAEGAEDSAQWSLSVFEDGLAIATQRLPVGQEGVEYVARFEGVGGARPYGWYLVSGRLPNGLSLSANGQITGRPTETGTFPFTVRLSDAARPPLYTERDFELNVALAPLKIVAEQQMDLFVTQVVTLSNLTVIGGNALPYRAQLEAQGGLRPYSWTEEPLPDNLRAFVPNSGLPAGLTLSPQGVLEGTVSDPSEMSEVEIPFTDIVLRGWFFFGQVRDAQEPHEEQQAIFFLPALTF